jgi:hypothetical protein
MADFKLGTDDIAALNLGDSDVAKVYRGTTEIWAGIDADAKAFFDAVEGGGDTLSQTEKDAVNALVVSLKADALWDEMQAVYPMVGGTSTSMKWNLVDPQNTDAAYRIDWVGASWTFDSNGAKAGNATGQYGDTHYSDDVNSTADGTHLSMYVNGGTNSQGYDLASNYAGSETLLLAGFGNNTYYVGFSGTTANTTSYTMPLGFFSGNGNNTNTIAYRNGTSVATQATARTTNQGNLYIGNRSKSTGTNADQPTDRRYAFISIGKGLDATGHSDLATHVETFQTSLGREN